MTVTIEKTGKQWKFLRVLSLPATAIGIVLLLVGLAGLTFGGEGAMVLALCGIGLLSIRLLVNFGTWWHHG